MNEKPRWLRWLYNLGRAGEVAAEASLGRHQLGLAQSRTAGLLHTAARSTISRAEALARDKLRGTAGADVLAAREAGVDSTLRRASRTCRGASAGGRGSAGVAARRGRSRGRRRSCTTSAARVAGKTGLLSDKLGLAQRDTVRLEHTAARGAVGRGEALTGDELRAGTSADVLATGESVVDGGAGTARGRGSNVGGRLRSGDIRRRRGAGGAGSRARAREVASQASLLGDDLGLAESGTAGLRDTAARLAVGGAEALAGNELGTRASTDALATGQASIDGTLVGGAGGAGGGRRSDGRSRGGSSRGGSGGASTVTETAAGLAVDVTDIDTGADTGSGAAGNEGTARLNDGLAAVSSAQAATGDELEALAVADVLGAVRVGSDGAGSSHGNGSNYCVLVVVVASSIERVQIDVQAMRAAKERAILVEGGCWVVKD